MHVFLDNAATTPLKPQVKEYIIELLDNFYNLSSLYQGGVSAKQIIEKARSNVANFINADQKRDYRLIFCYAKELMKN